MDVHVNIPRGKIQKRSHFEGEFAAPSSPSGQYKVDVHNVIGLFQTDLTKCPSNLDCGLFQFSYFQSYKTNMNKRDSKDKEKRSNKHDDSEEYPDYNFSEKESSMKCSWTSSDQYSGLSIGKTLTTTKKKFEFRVIGSCPSIEFLENKLPKDAKKWLGLN